MCGIAGILTTNDRHDNIANRLQRMQNSLQHRGPDDCGTYISADHQAALAHTRLAILDLSPSGHQPMSISDGRYWITFNGEIYNFQELRSQLVAQGEKFHSQTDTEVILKLYQKVGAECVKYLRGMFAFAIWDDCEKTCFLARDPLGIKPLYFWHSGSTFVFASELKAVMASQLPTASINHQGLYNYLISGSVPEPYTLIDQVECLPAGNCLSWQAGKLMRSQYWQIDFTPEPVSPESAVEKVRSALTDSIKHHFISDVPVGVFLSGGIDSTAVVALARQTQSGSKLQTYSIGFAESQWNEGEIAKRVAKHFDTEHTEYIITAALGRNLFEKYVTSIDQPSVDGFNTFCVSHVARENGIKVALSGLGGDELFGGYASFQKIPQMMTWGKRIKCFGAASHFVGKHLENWGHSTQVRRIGDFLQQPVNSYTAYRSFRGIFSHQEASAIATNYSQSFIPLPQFNPNRLPQLPTVADEVSFLEISQYMRNQLLRDSDVMSMASSLELRVPLVDRVLLESVASIPSQLRLATGKQLLVNAVSGLPDWVVNRPKQGFTFPFQQWLTKDWSDLFDSQNYNNIPLTSWYRRWSLVMLQYWWERVIA